MPTRRAEVLAAERELTYVHAFDDPDVIAGQGTLALELLGRRAGAGRDRGAGRRRRADLGRRAWPPRRSARACA